MGKRLSPGLEETDFKQIAANGFGDGLNSYSHTMAWFQDHLYVGTTRANLCMVKANNPPSLRCWPTKCPEDVYDLDLRAQIWRYSPQAKTWQQVFISPLAPGSNGQQVPRDLGYRGIALFQGPSDSAPALYVSTWASSRSGRTPIIMRSIDGSQFIPVSQLGTDPTINSYRSLYPFNGRLYISPTGRAGGQQNVSAAPIVLENLDPASEDWQIINTPGFGDQTNISIFELGAFNGSLYAGTMNPIHGFQIWKAKPVGNPPYKWVKVIDNGANRGSLNEGVASMCVFNDALYVGTGIQNGGYDRTYKVGPAGAEIIRIHPDDSWELIVGEARDTPQGYKYPLSGLGAGFDDFFNGYIWRMTVHSGWLYAGTYNWSVWLPYLTIERWPVVAQTLVRQIGLDNIIKHHAGFDLWRSRDGMRWFPVTNNGFNNRYNFGARTMVSTPSGLFLGTANPFGPEVAVETANGWMYVPNPQGGLEIWHGVSRKRSAKDEAEVCGRHQLELVEAPPSGARKMAQTIERVMQERAKMDNRYLSRIEKLVATRPRRTSRISSRRTPGEEVMHDTTLNKYYDDVMYNQLRNEYYGDSDFFNFGYWLNGVRSQKEACENLMEELLGFIPEKKGNILDVACGKGATTKYLLNYYKPSRVTGINISERQLETCRANTPGCNFLLMDATKLSFRSASFNNIICVESAFHFETREDFLREALRVLKPGGRLALSDILFMTEAVEGLSPYRTSKNFVKGLEEYESLYRHIGFVDVEVSDATYECLIRFCEHASRFVRRKYLTLEIDRRVLVRTLLAIHFVKLSVRHYVLVSARKPGGEGPSG